MNENVMQNNEEIEIDLVELFYVLLHKWWVICIGALIGGIGMMLFTSFAMTPQYESKAMLYILNKTTSVTSVADIQIGNAITRDFVVIAESKPVLDGAIEQVEIDYGKKFTRKQILAMLDVSHIEDTRVVVFKATSDDPEAACAVANAVAEVTARQMAQIMNSDAPRMVEKAEVESKPVGPSVMKNTLLGAFAGVFLVCLFFGVRFLLDDSIKNEEDVRKYLGTPTLASIPLIKTKERKKAAEKEALYEKDKKPSKK